MLGVLAGGVLLGPAAAQIVVTLPGPPKPNVPLETLDGRFKFNEGPVYHPDGYLLFSDEQQNTIYRWDPRARTEVFRHPARRPNGLALDGQGRLLVCEHETRRVSRTEADGRIVTLADRFDGKRLNSPNDLVVRGDGTIFFTDPPFGLPNLSEGKELSVNGVYKLSSNGTLTLVAKDFELPNGLVFSPDEKRLYVNDSAKRHIRVFQVKADGTLSGGRVFARMPGEADEWGADGMKVDARGNVYSAGAKGVWIFAPTGKLRGRIFAPEVITNLAWGDKDRKTLYLTGMTSLYRVRRAVGGPPARLRAARKLAK